MDPIYYNINIIIIYNYIRDILFQRLFKKNINNSIIQNIAQLKL